MKLIGLTGGVGTGKSTVAWMFEGMGVKSINADLLSHTVIAPQTKAWKQLFDRYGGKILLKDKKIDRKALAHIIFNDEHERKFVESVIHPKVKEELLKQIADAKKNHIPMLIIEVPLLFETKWDKDMDFVIVVKCDYESQIKRGCNNTGITKEEAISRLAAHMPLAQKIEKADYVIDSSGPKSKTKTQAQKIFKQLQHGIVHP